MMEQSAVVQRALDALRAVCVTESDRRPLNVPVFRAISSCDPAAWFVNGKRVTVFPHCPRCASYALYRKDNQGDYECLTCGLAGIEESTARRMV
jgi:hypothetical protein